MESAVGSAACAKGLFGVSGGRAWQSELGRQAAPESFSPGQPSSFSSPRLPQAGRCQPSSVTDESKF